MADHKLAIRVILRFLWKKGLNARAAAKEINDVEGTGSVNERTAQNWFKRFKEGDTTLQEKPRSGRPSVVDNEVLLEAIQHQPSSSTRALSAELGPSQSTINRHLHQLGLVNRRCREVPHELTPSQQKRRVEVCKELLSNPQDLRFWRRIVTGDEKWIFFRNPDMGKQWQHPGQPPKPVVKRGRFEQKVMLCVWWNFEGVVHFEFVPHGRAVDADLYSQQLERVYDVLKARYPALVNRQRALLQHDNAPAHRAIVTKEKLAHLQGIEVLPHPAYSPDLAPSDYHLFRSLAHFLSGRQFTNVTDVETGCREFFASKPAEWYKHGIELLAERWQKTILHNGIYFEE